MQYEATLGETVFDIVLNLDESTAALNDKELTFDVVEHGDSQILFRVGTKLHKIRNILWMAVRLNVQLTESGFQPH